LRQRAKQAHASGTSIVYVVRDVATDQVVAYSALASGSVLATESPTRVATGTGGYDIPVVILTRLGVDVSAQGCGLGRALLVHTLRTVDSTADKIGVRALLIHAETDEARAFYESQAGFERSPTDPLHLFLLMKDLRKAIRQ